MTQQENIESKGSTEEQYDNSRHSQRCQLPNCCQGFAWSAAKEILKEYHGIATTISHYLPDTIFLKL